MNPPELHLSTRQLCLFSKFRRATKIIKQQDRMNLFNYFHFNGNTHFTNSSIHKCKIKFSCYQHDRRHHSKILLKSMQLSDLTGSKVVNALNQDPQTEKEEPNCGVKFIKQHGGKYCEVNNSEQTPKNSGFCPQSREVRILNFVK